MAKRKTPGVDGLPAEFYQRFWPALGADLVDVFNYCNSHGRLSFSQRSGLITLLYKRGDRMDMKNWRPITLLCVDYKIAAKAIANRLLQVLPSVIHNFGPSFCHWIQLFYTQISSSVLVNGEQSASFCVSRGVRQGCPLSPLLYVIMAETLACAIRSDPLIDGFSLPGRRRIKLCQYADDTSIVVMSDVSLLQVFSVFNRYELASGAKLNVTKSYGLLVGSWASRSNLPIALDWSSSSITVMGTTLSNVADDSSCWTPLLDQLRLTLADWQQRHLSYHGRALVVNSLGLSPLWYLASFRTMPVSVVTAINACVFFLPVAQ